VIQDPPNHSLSEPRRSGLKSSPDTWLELYDNLPQGAGGDHRMRGMNVGSEKASFVERWPELASFGKRRCLGKYLAVVRSAFA
jgi:hypothetical protein